MTDSTLYIEKQESLAQDQFSHNGVTKKLHIVAKAIPFTVHLASSLVLSRCTLTATLIYDESENNIEREVETVKSTPIEYVAHVSNDGRKAAVEVKLSVLSSQHEGAFFRIKFSILDNSSDAYGEAMTDPIKVISKRNQVKKIMERKEATMASMNNDSSSSTPTTTKQRTTTSARPTSTIKPDATDLIAETLLRLEQQQREQFKLIQKIDQQQQTTSLKRGRSEISTTNSFESAFQSFLHAYASLPSYERSQKVRKVLTKVSTSDQMLLNEFALLSSEVPIGVNHHTDDVIVTPQTQDGETNNIMVMNNNKVCNNDQCDDIMMSSSASFPYNLIENDSLTADQNSFVDDHTLDDLYSDLLSSPHSTSSDVEFSSHHQ